MKQLIVALFTIPALLGALNLRDYKVDKSSTQLLSTGFNYHFGMTAGEVVSNFGNLSVNFERFQARLPSSYVINLFGNVNGNFMDSSEDTFYTDTVPPDTSKQINYHVQWEAKYFKYLVREKDYFAFGKLDGDAATTYDYPATRVTAGFGYGRFVNSTPLARALRIEEEMMDKGVLLDSLPLGTLLDFAKALALETRKEYRERYYHWEREYFLMLEEILNRSNLLHNADLGSAGSLVIQDVLEEYISPRYYGYEVNAGVGYDLLPAYQADGRSIFASLAFNSATPLGFKTQFIEKASLRIPFTGRKFGKEMHSSLLLSLSYELAAQIDVIGTYQLKLDRIRSDESNDYSMVVHNQFNGTFAYLIVDHLVMSNTLTLSHSTQSEGLSAEVSSAISFRFF